MTYSVLKVPLNPNQPTNIAIDVLRFDENSVLLHKYRRLLKLKVRVLVASTYSFFWLQVSR